MNIRLLSEEDIPVLHNAFNLAFSSHSITIKPTLKDFEYRIFHKIHVDFDISAAAFDGSEMLGFIMHASNVYEGIPTAYNGGTGVIPGFRHQHTAEDLYRYLFPILRSHSIARILLEVVDNNENAIRLYEKLGFVFRRSFRCYKQVKPLDLTHTQQVESGVISEVDFSFNDFEPSFGDTQAQLIRGNETVLLAKKNNKVVGHLIFQPHNGRISQIGISRLFRSERFGESLVFHAQKLTRKPLTIMNIPSGEFGMHKFLTNCGFENQVDQYEMELIL